MKEFLERSQRERASRRVTLLPDLFIDQIITIPRTPKQFLSEARRIVKRGGGNYTGVSAQLTRGGCAANCAAALSSLEIPTSLISRTAEVAIHLLKLTSDLRHLDLSHIRTDGKLAATAALEMQDNGNTINLMVTDPGSSGRFSPDDLDEEDFELLKHSFIVGIFSWNLNKHGTGLLEKVAGYCVENGVQTYVDLGDPIPRIRQLPQLVDRVIREGLVNYLSVNENELRSLSRSLALSRWRDRPARDLAEEVAAQLPVELALHTPNYAGFAKGSDAVFGPAFDVILRRSTGAGDAWNAGNIFGLLKEAEPETRLIMANLLAAVHISSRQPKPHSLRELSGYVNKVRLKPFEQLS